MIVYVTQADFAEAVYPDADIRLYPTQDEVNLDMVSGRIDMQVGDMLPMQDWTTKTVAVGVTKQPFTFYLTACLIHCALYVISELVLATMQRRFAYKLHLQYKVL